MIYKDIPIESNKLELRYDWCGDCECNCYNFNISSYKDNEHIMYLWSSDNISYEDINELRKQVQEASKYYKLNPNLDSKYVSNWECDRIL